ncbi:MAG: hypothetical protein PHF37_00600 [Phycisphaerae bacterium]|nr:hypothetical protein [Phycisphaerae bacterium]
MKKLAKNILKKRRCGFTLVDALLAAVVIMIAVIGTMCFRYYAMTNAVKAAMRLTAARTASALMENWRGVDGASGFDPTNHLADQLDISSDDGPDEPDGYTKLGSYKIEINNADYYTTLSWIAEDTGLRRLNVDIAWVDGHPGDVNFVDVNKETRLTSYALNSGT